MAREANRVRRSFLWRVTITLLLCGLGLLAYHWNIELTRVPPAEDPVGEYYSEVYHPGPWIEMSRVTSPDGETDAVLVQDSKSEADQWILFLLPAGQSVPGETPYRSHRIHLERLVRDTAMVAVQVKGMEIAWTGARELKVSGETAVFYSKKPIFRPTGDVGLVSLEYEIKQSRVTEPL